MWGLFLINNKEIVHITMEAFPYCILPHFIVTNIHDYDSPHKTNFFAKDIV